MNSYFSDFISRFSGEFGFSSSGDLNVDAETTPKIQFVTLFNPTWVDKDDESFESVSKQIIFFSTPVSQDTEHTANQHDSNRELHLNEQLNLVGLLRGSCALASDFGAGEGATVIDLSNGAIVVKEVEQDYFVAVSLFLRSDDATRRAMCIEQLKVLISQTHSLFTLTQSSLHEFLRLHGSFVFSDILRRHWSEFLSNFNSAADLPFGPSKIVWPNRMNAQGFFHFFPENAYKKSFVGLPNQAKREIERLVLHGNASPTGFVLANLGKKSIKEDGLVHMGCSDKCLLDQTSVINVYTLLETLHTGNALESGFLGGVSRSEGILTQLTKQWQRNDVMLQKQVAESGIVDADDENNSIVDSTINPSTALAMFHPLKLTNKLVVEPINGTVSGIKTLGMAVQDQILEAPSWLGKWTSSGTSPEPRTEEGAAEPSASASAQATRNTGVFLVGHSENDQITRFLVKIPTTTGENSTDVREYSLVIYTENDTYIVLFFESGVQYLETREFYKDLKENLCQPVLEVLDDHMNGSGLTLSNSINSLPEPIDAAFRGIHEEKVPHLQDVDGDFFFVIYDTRQNYYQTSLPYPPAWQEFSGDARDPAKALQRVLFHLHDHLIEHFIIKTNKKLLRSDALISEHLNKFSSNKNNDWLFYSIRHNSKVIIIIRNYNHKEKAKAPQIPESNYLLRIADSVYEKANFGFLENLGGDVRVWLGGLEKDAQENANED